MATRRVTAADVAKSAGVSKTTVSYVLNNTSNQTIPEHTRQKVMDAVAALGYQPSAAARALRTGRDDSVLLLLPDWPLSGPVSAVVESLLDQLNSHGLSLKTRREGHLPADAREWVQTAPQAVIALHKLAPGIETELTQQGIFVAHALLAAPTNSRHTVVFPQSLVGSLQVQHLASTGHRRIGYVAPNDDRLTPFSSLRIDGALTAALELGLDEPVVEHLHPTREDAARLLKIWRGLEEPIDGIAAYNDVFAAALLAAARELGVAVPGQLALIGVDNEPLSAFTFPPLTTIDQHSDTIATALADLIVDGISGEPTGTRPLPPEPVSLVVRDST